LPGLMQEAKRLFEVYRETHGAYRKGDMNYFDWLTEEVDLAAREEEPDYGPENWGFA